MSGYTPTTGEVRDSLVYLNKYHAKQYGDVDLLVVGSETAAQFDRMIATVELAAAYKALTDAAASLETPRYISSYNQEPPMLRMTKEQIVEHLRDRAGAYRREGKE